MSSTSSSQSKLGSTARIAVSTTNIETSYNFFSKLGFMPMPDQTPRIEPSMSFLRLTDGQIILTLLKEEFPSPLIAYFADDLTEITSLVTNCVPNAKIASDDDGQVQEITFELTDNLPIDIHRDSRNSALRPTGEKNPVCGTFGEFTIGVAELSSVVDKCKQLGFDKINTFTSPYPWAIVRDDRIVLGIHQNDQIRKPALTYFTTDAAAVIANLKTLGLIPIYELPDQSGVVNGAGFISPDGTIVNIFFGEL